MFSFSTVYLSDCRDIVFMKKFFALNYILGSVEVLIVGFKSVVFFDSPMRVILGENRNKAEEKTTADN